MTVYTLIAKHIYDHNSVPLWTPSARLLPTHNRSFATEKFHVWLRPKPTYRLQDREATALMTEVGLE